ncbi:50S ribosomal protein L7/L12 [Candidatus Roizmanbacteria bacterium RIFOXYB2_FULL_41_10]|nr:MAG: 50S ribosomal protein L7/L12 [Candidatus Roizmanbacteria bacterium RIFOXYB1_FULL_41_27]OGK67318.1 MAG: 50S ribosomal protein L7/L12 [Candidatus Roizmanbacteria bacterium RIFOXYA2_FULL_41_8]OGK70671.1 MAG: 50S ribosomal protein L7/L12 [Candidatus Roizmanbacteria bacterium RIFOXYB2_FULL_41_10]OGK70866.1 MAG: 50S ribosomal protein L7/L12 [Candidatus Roizmanbacteria bacterium RIFOXYC1_FULL_41_16]OGK75145.1 MAG: 50S ribosomal protein L7/L12 [Candidatus Roizmanbacteria bacterium RIFOXYC2_FULL
MAESKVEKILKEIEELKVLELNELVKAIEDKFGVSAAPAMMAAAPAAAGAGAAPEAEKTTFDVVITDAGANKLQVIKAVREIDQALGLIDAKKLVEAAPKEVLKAAKKDAAEEAKKKLEAAGAKVELK